MGRGNFCFTEKVLFFALVRKVDEDRMASRSFIFKDGSKKIVN